MQASFRLPSKKQIKYLAHLLTPMEKRIFVFFLVLFIVSGVGLLILLDKNYSIAQPIPGGSLKEGIVGSPTSINPLLAISDADRDLVDLIYAGLMRADGKGGLEPELAERFNVSDDGLIYTFWLKDNLAWHDNSKLTADDVIFTIEMVKNPSIKSPIRANWEGVETEKVDDKTIKFILKRPYVPFLENTKIGILPKHLWAKVLSQEFNLTPLNIAPIGSGPYKIESLKKNPTGGISSIKLESFKYYQPHEPYLKNITFDFYPREEELLTAYQNGEIETLNIAPKAVVDIETENKNLLHIALPQIFAVFFNQDASDILSKYVIRQALNASIDRESIINSVYHGYALPQYSPIFPNIGSNKTATGEDLSKEEIRTMLEEKGWEPNEEGFLEKEKEDDDPLQLKFTLSTSDNPELMAVGKILQDTWREIGINVDLQIFELGDLEKNVIQPREYETLLFGQVVGFNPDPFAFWHSSQKDYPGLNVAMYTNPKADRLLEDARTSIDLATHDEKYEEFQKELQKELPALFLYSPSNLYIFPKDIRGVEIERITLTAERFSQIEQWYKNTQNIWKILAR
ncbi:ABC transporter substrate-binding protein [Patescibacteria group bacterium]